MSEVEVQPVNETTSALDELRAMISSKTKNGPKKKETARFIELWVKCAETIGVNEETVQLLIDGFQFAFGEPLYRYAKKTQDRVAYVSFAATKAAKTNDQGTSLKVALNLFAYELIDPSGSDSLHTIARTIAKFAHNKEGKVFGTIDRSLPNVLIRPLKKKVIAEGAQITAGEAASIAAIVRAPLEERAKSGKARTDEVEAIVNLLVWLGAQSDANKTSSLTIDRAAGVAAVASPVDSEGVGAVAVANTSEAPLDSNERDNPTPIDSTPATPAEDTEQSAPSSHEPASGTLSAPVQTIDLTPVISNLVIFQKQYDELARNCQAFEEESKQSSRRATMLEQRVRELTRDNSTLRGQVETLSKRCVERQSAIDDLQEQNKQLDDQLKSANEMLDLHERGEERQADEGLRRLAAELKTEYEDFLDAANDPIEDELGMNMRDALAEVFKILKKNGVEL